jgi:hypothetical protein
MELPLSPSEVETRIRAATGKPFGFGIRSCGPPALMTRQPHLFWEECKTFRFGFVPTLSIRSFLCPVYAAGFLLLLAGQKSAQQSTLARSRCYFCSFGYVTSLIQPFQAGTPSFTQGWRFWCLQGLRPRFLAR